MDRTINARDLRLDLPRIVKRVQKGERFTVLYRSRPAFRLVPVDDATTTGVAPLEEDPLYRAEAIGRSGDGLTSTDHDAVLYRR
ncbi:MAG: type II toxin-antitoxin system prevent-host-death family antitoxin [Deltaproteobacteria bacterium]|nr:type II toxin-antitoxin system prevent-host-death family antitoxin [Deltaproteobacteria bacterium]